MNILCVLGIFCVMNVYAISTDCMTGSILQSNYANEHVSTLENVQYRYLGEGLADRISNNTCVEYPNLSSWQTPQSMTPRANAPEQDDEPPVSWDDPYATPVGDVPLLALVIWIICLVMHNQRKKTSKGG